MSEPDSKLDQVAHAVIGAAIEVHRTLGPGFLESVYEEALAVELDLRGIEFRRQVPVAVNYKGRAVGEARLDFLAEDFLSVELTAVDELAPIHQAQVTTYLKATGHHLALFINFNLPVLRDGIRSIVLS